MSETTWKYLLRLGALACGTVLVLVADVEPTTAYAAAGGVALGVTLPLPGRASVE